ncbi:MAG: hypothetical protein ACRDP5_21355 [Streptosporangiaceae bacterium]
MTTQTPSAAHRRARPVRRSWTWPPGPGTAASTIAALTSADPSAAAP